MLGNDFGEGTWEERCIKATTKHEKLDIMIEWLTERHLEYHGGYPHDHAWIGSILVIADLNDGKDRHQTQITTYTKKRLLRWFDRAKIAKKNVWPEEDFNTCLLEMEGETS